MLKFATLTAIGLATALTMGGTGAYAQTQSQSEKGMQQQGQQQGQAQQRQARQGQTGQQQMRVPVLLVFVDRDGDQMVSADEARQAREHLFLILDADEDQQLTRDEYGGGVTREQTARTFMESDRDRDQQLSAREYLGTGEQRYREQLEQSGRDPAEGLTVSEYQESAGITEEEAMAADVDRDEMITVDEAAYDTVSRFRRLDDDGDGYITHEELRQSDLELRRDREFAELDENDDGQLSREEFTQGGQFTEGTSFQYRATEEETGGTDEGTGDTGLGTAGGASRKQGSGTSGASGTKSDY